MYNQCGSHQEGYIQGHCRQSKVGRMSYVMFKKTVLLYPIKKRAASFLNGFKNIPGKACVNRIHNNYAFVNVGN